MRDRFVLNELCEAPGVSRSGCHAARRARALLRAQADARLLEQMRLIHADRNTHRYGSPRMTRELRARGHACPKNRAARLMRLDGLRARPRRPFRPKTTTPDHGAHPHGAHPSPNLLAELAAPSAPGVQLVGDIAYIPTTEGWLYLAVVIDPPPPLRARLEARRDFAQRAGHRRDHARSGQRPGRPRGHLPFRSRLPILGRHHARSARARRPAPEHGRQRLLLRQRLC